MVDDVPSSSSHVVSNSVSAAALAYTKVGSPTSLCVVAAEG